MAECDEHRFAGEVRLDNHAELARLTGTDPANGAGDIILAALIRFGLPVIDRIEGEFSFAWWAPERGRLILARDALGRRPLFMARTGDCLHFGDHPAKVAAKIGRPRADIGELIAFALQRGHPGTASFFAGVERIAPATLIEIADNGSIVTRHWWKPDFSPTPLDDDALFDALEAELDRSVEAILRHHSRFAAHLSAGLDSSLSALAISRRLGPGERLHAMCASPERVVTVAGEQAIGDEFPLAAQTAAMLGNVDVERITATNDDWVALSDRYAAAAGMPIPNQGNLGWLDATFARAHAIGATVLVESTQGNTTYSWQGKGIVPTLLRQMRFREFADYFGKARRLSGGSGLMTIPWGLFPMFPPRAVDAILALSGAPSPASGAMLRPRHPLVREKLRELQRSGKFTRATRHARSPRDRLEILHWGSMSSLFAAVEQLHGVIPSDPFAAKRLVELTLRIEDPRFFEGGYGRRFARLMLKGHVPDIVAAGRIDWQQGTDWRDAALASRDTIEADLDYAAADPVLGELFDVPRMRDEVASWVDGTDSLAAMARGGAVMRAVAAIRFTRIASAT